MENKNDLEFVYIILAYDNPDEIVQLIKKIQYENKHSFIIHVDAVEESDATYSSLREFASHYSNVYVLPTTERVRTNPKGFSVVHAILQMIRFIFNGDIQNGERIHFHKIIFVSTNLYSSVSDALIKNVVMSNSLNANILKLNSPFVQPDPDSWKYIIECDDKLHEIFHLPLLTKDHNKCELRKSSEKSFILSEGFAGYLAKSSGKNFFDDFLEYAQHMTYAHDFFFGTVLLHSPYCHTFVNGTII